MTITVFLDGLHQIGYSLALALPKEVFELQAFHPDNKTLNQLKREKVIKKAIGQIAQGCKNADIIIINQPVDFLELHYEAIGLNSKPGAIVIDTSPVPVYAGELAGKFLKPETPFVSMVPAFNSDALKEEAFIQASGSADLFKDSMVAISSPNLQLKDGEQVAARLASAVGAIPVFMDPYEVQEAMVKTHFLPNLVALAVQRAVSQHPGWRDEEKIASSEYYQITNPLLGFVELEHPELGALQNKDALVRILDEVIAEMEDIKQLLASDKQQKLHNLIEETHNDHLGWLGKRRSNAFDDVADTSDLPKANDIFQNMFLGGLGRKK